MLPSQRRSFRFDRALSTRKPLPVPTLADLDAQVYAQTWHHGNAAGEVDNIKGFDVLAFDPEDALIVGGIRLAAMDCDAFEWTSAENKLCGDSVEMVAAILEFEDVEEKDHRQHEYELRHREPDEPDLNAVSARELSDRAYELNRRLR